MAEARRELPITGYLDRLSYRPGEALTAMVSVASGAPFRARLVHVRNADPNPRLGGLRCDDLAEQLDVERPGRRQPIYLGSRMRALAPRRATPGALTLTALVEPGIIGTEPQTVIAWEDAARSIALSVTAGGLQLTLRNGDRAVSIATGTALPLRRWARVWGACDPHHGRMLVGQSLGPEGDGMIVQDVSFSGLDLPVEGDVIVAARRRDAPVEHFNGKLEEPAVLDGWLSDLPAKPLDRDAQANLLALWDFSRGISTQAVEDIGPQELHGALANLPTRAVRGALWDGSAMAWTQKPSHYGAIRFYEDDLGDCGWSPSLTWTIPSHLPGGSYALHITCPDGEDWLPFYVRPPTGAPKSSIALLASTFTYQAYFNHARGNCDEVYRARARDWGAYPHNPDDYPLYGRSTYNKHPDGHGVAFSSRLRPALTMRPGFLTFVDAQGSGLRHYPADSHLTAWLDAKGLPYDVVTDEDLDDEGLELLRPYRTVLTGSHPEYHTGGMLDALRDYTLGGGRLAYLGGNGFYWRIARSPDATGVIEVRRAEGGIRAWAAEPGEYYQAFDGSYGGLWRRNNRPPQALVGVGFSAQGLFEGSYYRRQPASYEPRFAWMFEGVDDDILGDFGFSGGGAAGFELDRVDPMLGTPPGTTILARSEAHTSSFVAVPEELLSHIATVSGEKPTDLIRAEIVYLERPNGGAVFSVGSITFCGSLPHNGFSNNVSRLLENVVRQFAELG